MPAPTRDATPPILWSIAGHDSSGGAGLAADQRAADAMGLHLCPVLASVTAQHSRGVDAVFPLPPAQLEAQLAALAQDMPPAVIKTGLLGDVRLIEMVGRWVDMLRQSHPGLALVVDPVLGATAGGAAFSDEQVLAAVRRELLPRASLITPNRAEARRLLGLPARHDGADEELPRLAARLRQLGAQAVVVTGGDAQHRRHPAWVLDWLDTPQAQGWLCGPRVDTPHHHGSGCTFASACAAGMAMGHEAADAVVLGKMVVHQALADAHAAGAGAGPVKAGRRPSLGPLPWLGMRQALPWQLEWGEGSHHGPALFQAFDPPEDGLYGILPDAAMLGAAAQAGMRCVQLRHKSPEGVEAQIEQAVQHCHRHGATLFINDHWQHALSWLAPQTLPLPAPGAGGHRLGVHLGQEDLLALEPAAIDRLLGARGQLLLGLSSHSLWELARAAGCGPSLIACGPVQPTSTKAMPWRPQGEDNLRWWTTHSPAPVVAIGGLLGPADLRRFAGCGAAALCVVRALGDLPSELPARLDELRHAVRRGPSQTRGLDEKVGRATMLMLPHPVL